MDDIIEMLSWKYSNEVKLFGRLLNISAWSSSMLWWDGSEFKEGTLPKKVLVEARLYAWYFFSPTTILNSLLTCTSLLKHFHFPSWKQQLLAKYILSLYLRLYLRTDVERGGQAIIAGLDLPKSSVSILIFDIIITFSAPPSVEWGTVM